jgi:hypothetical protein
MYSQCRPMHTKIVYILSLLGQKCTVSAKVLSLRKLKFEQSVINAFTCDCRLIQKASVQMHYSDF